MNPQKRYPKSFYVIVGYSDYRKPAFYYGMGEWTAYREDAETYPSRSKAESAKIALLSEANTQRDFDRGLYVETLLCQINPRPPKGTPEYIKRRSERPPRNRPTKRLKRRRRANRRERVFSNPDCKYYVITVNGKRRAFTTRAAADKAANEIFQRTGIVVGIEVKHPKHKWRGRVFSNPGKYALFAKRGVGPKMHFTGEKFSNNGKPKVFPSLQLAKHQGEHLMLNYPILKKYRMTVENILGKM